MDSLVSKKMNNAWQFDDVPNTACIATTDVLDNGAPITEVYHDYDGGWQFLNTRKQPFTADDARVVCLSSMVELDSSIAELHGLDYGWRAIRRSPKSAWVTEKNHPYPEFATDGYYLENADWMAQYKDDVNQPPLKQREDLLLEHWCKLIFRFRDEKSDREDYDSERMWVVVTDVDDYDFYTGILQNTPERNTGLTEGDQVRFHPSHIIEVREVG